MVRLATKEDIDKIVDLHATVLHWSINGRLGRAHVRRLYEALFEGDDFFVVVADDPKSGAIVGFASGSTNAAAARGRIKARVGLIERFKLLSNALVRPKELFDILETVLVIPLLQSRLGTDAEILTWVAKQNSPAGAVAARRCFDGVLAQLAARGCETCVAQVLRSNAPPNRFHKARGTRKAWSLLINNIYLIDCPAPEAT
jgi:hypothetical protein